MSNFTRLLALLSLVLALLAIIMTHLAQAAPLQYTCTSAQLLIENVVHNDKILIEPNEGCSIVVRNVECAGIEVSATAQSTQQPLNNLGTPMSVTNSRFTISDATSAFKLAGFNSFANGEFTFADNVISNASCVDFAMVYMGARNRQTQFRSANIARNTLLFRSPFCHAAGAFSLLYLPSYDNSGTSFRITDNIVSGDVVAAGGWSPMFMNRGPAGTENAILAELFLFSNNTFNLSLVNDGYGSVSYLYFGKQFYSYCATLTNTSHNTIRVNAENHGGCTVWFQGAGDGTPGGTYLFSYNNVTCLTDGDVEMMGFRHRMGGIGDFSFIGNRFEALPGPVQAGSFRGGGKVKMAAYHSWAHSQFSNIFVNISDNYFHVGGLLRTSGVIVVIELRSEYNQWTGNTLLIARNEMLMEEITGTDAKAELRFLWHYRSKALPAVITNMFIEHNNIRTRRAANVVIHFIDRLEQPLRFENLRTLGNQMELAGVGGVHLNTISVRIYAYSDANSGSMLFQDDMVIVSANGVGSSSNARQISRLDVLPFSFSKTVSPGVVKGGITVRGWMVELRGISVPQMNRVSFAQFSGSDFQLSPGITVENCRLVLDRSGVGNVKQIAPLVLESANFDFSGGGGGKVQAANNTIELQSGSSFSFASTGDILITSLLINSGAVLANLAELAVGSTNFAVTGGATATRSSVAGSVFFTSLAMFGGTFSVTSPTVKFVNGTAAPPLDTLFCSFIGKVGGSVVLAPFFVSGSNAAATPVVPTSLSLTDINWVLDFASSSSSSCSGFTPDWPSISLSAVRYEQPAGTTGGDFSSTRTDVTLERVSIRVLGLPIRSGGITGVRVAAVIDLSNSTMTTTTAAPWRSHSIRVHDCTFELSLIQKQFGSHGIVGGNNFARFLHLGAWLQRAATVSLYNSKVRLTTGAGPESTDAACDSITGDILLAHVAHQWLRTERLELSVILKAAAREFIVIGFAATTDSLSISSGDFMSSSNTVFAQVSALHSPQPSPCFITYFLLSHSNSSSSSSSATTPAKLTITGSGLNVESAAQQCVGIFLALCNFAMVSPSSSLQQTPLTPLLSSCSEYSQSSNLASKPPVILPTGSSISLTFNSIFFGVLGRGPVRVLVFPPRSNIRSLFVRSVRFTAAGHNTETTLGTDMLLLNGGDVRLRCALAKPVESKLFAASVTNGASSFVDAECSETQSESISFSTHSISMPATITLTATATHNPTATLSHHATETVSPTLSDLDTVSASLSSSSSKPLTETQTVSISVTHPTPTESRTQELALSSTQPTQTATVSKPPTPSESLSESRTRPPQCTPFRVAVTVQSRFERADRGYTSHVALLRVVLVPTSRWADGNGADSTANDVMPRADGKVVPFAPAFSGVARSKKMDSNTAVKHVTPAGPVTIEEMKLKASTNNDKGQQQEQHVVREMEIAVALDATLSISDTHFFRLMFAESAFVCSLPGNMTSVGTASVTFPRRYDLASQDVVNIARTASAIAVFVTVAVTGGASTGALTAMRQQRSRSAIVAIECSAATGEDPASPLDHPLQFGLGTGAPYARGMLVGCCILNAAAVILAYGFTVVASMFRGGGGGGSNNKATTVFERGARWGLPGKLLVPFCVFTSGLLTGAATLFALHGSPPIATESEGGDGDAATTVTTTSADIVIGTGALGAWLLCIVVATNTVRAHKEQCSRAVPVPASNSARRVDSMLMRVTTWLKVALQDKLEWKVKKSKNNNNDIQNAIVFHGHSRRARKSANSNSNKAWFRAWSPLFDSLRVGFAWVPLAELALTVGGVFASVLPRSPAQEAACGVARVVTCLVTGLTFALSVQNGYIAGVENLYCVSTSVLLVVQSLLLMAGEYRNSEEFVAFGEMADLVMMWVSLAKAVYDVFVLVSGAGAFNLLMAAVTTTRAKRVRREAKRSRTVTTTTTTAAVSMVPLEQELLEKEERKEPGKTTKEQSDQDVVI